VLIPLIDQVKGIVFTAVKAPKELAGVKVWHVNPSKLQPVSVI
jgi:hypothetical protein